MSNYAKRLAKCKSQITPHTDKAMDRRAVLLTLDNFLAASNTDVYVCIL